MRGHPEAALLFLLAAIGAADSSAILRGVVVNSRGSPVAHARVSWSAGASRRVAETDVAGRFALDGGNLVGVLTVEARGFSTETRALEGGEEPPPFLRIVLAGNAYAETVTVTASRAPARLSETAASVAEVSGEALAANPAMSIDAALRQVPGFTLFRRSDSRTANPTTQGVSLRGVGGSGASRAVVLDDRIPLNDPFGGWVAWGRVVRESLDRVEILRGGSSDLYGGAALAGAINLVPRVPAGRALAAEASYGTQRSGDAAAFAAGRSGDWVARLDGEAFRTDGYLLIPSSARGAVDRPASSRHEVGEARIAREPDSGPAVFVRGSIFDESRGNGTVLQVNDTRLWQAAAGADGEGLGGAYAVRAYGLEETYHQTFTSVSADRGRETPTRLQTVPSSSAGFTGQDAVSFGSHRLVAGLEGRQVSGESDEVVLGGGGSSVADAGGTQRTGALFLEDRVALSARLSLFAGLRLDAWRNFDAFRATGPTQDAATRADLPARAETAWSPRLSALFQATDSVAVTASGYRSFRAPTLNELYRNFRAGNTLTLANADLAAERLTGGEVGVRVCPPGAPLTVSATAFWMEIEGTITNVTLSVSDSLITRQRRNVGQTRSRGVELDADARPLDSLVLTAGYLHADSTVVRFAQDLSLEGRRVAQVPRDQLSLTLRYDYRGLLRLSVQGRYSAAQFDDDANTLRLPGFTQWDAGLAVPLTRGCEAFVQGENLANTRSVVGRTPLPTLGPPRIARAGLRLSL